MSRFVPYPSAPPGPPPINAPPPSYAFSGPGAPYRPLLPQTHADYPRPHSLPQSNDHGFVGYMNSIASMIQAQPREIMEALAPHFASIHTKIDSLKTSIDRVQTGSATVRQDVSKVQQDVSRISSDVSNIGETLSTVVRAQQAANSSDTRLDVRSSRGQAKSRDPMPSTDVEMMDNAVRYVTQAEPNSNVRTTPAHLSTPSPIRDTLSRQWNPGPAPGRFSKAEWGMQVPAPSQSPTGQSPLLSHVDENSSPHPFVPGHSEEPHEVQQLPSPPEIPTLSQEEAFVQSQLQPDSQSQSPSIRHQRQAETPARPVNIEKCTLPVASSVSSSTSGSTGLFSPISPQDPAYSRGETLQRIFDLLQRQEEGMPIASFAMSDLPDLQYPSQPGMEEEEENGGEKSGEVDKGCDGGNVETREVERVEVAHGQGKQRSVDEDPFAMPLPLAKETREHQEKEELQPQKFMRKKMPLFLPDSEPPSVKSMSPAPVVPLRRVDAQVLSPHSRQPYYDHEDEGEEHHQEAKSPDSSQDTHRPLITSSEEVEVQLTTLSEIESSEESSDGEDDGEEMDELLSSHEDDVHSRSSDEIGYEKEGFESQLDVERTLLTESQRREEENKEFMEDVYRGESGVELESGSQVEAARLLIPESQMREEADDGGSGEVDEAMGDVRQEGEVEIGFESQLDVERTLLPESQIQEEGTMGVIGQETGLESEPGTQVDLPGMLIPQSQGGDGGDESMGDVRQEAVSGGREEMEVTPHESSRDFVPSTMDANPRGDDIPMTIESSINTFTPRKEVRDLIEPFQRMGEEGQGEGQGREELDRQMQVDDDGSQPQFENYHHETDHLSPDLSYQSGLEKSSSGQLHDLVQSVEPNLPLDNDEVEPLSPLPPNPESESPVELTPPPSTQVPDNNLLRESGIAGVMPPSSADSMAPISSTQARNRTQQQQQAEPVIPIALPEYISPVNSPSPSKSPLPVLERGRKRKFQEMRMQSLFRTLGSSGGGGSGRRGEQVKQVQLVTPTRNGIEKKRTLLASGGASGSTSPDGGQSASKVGSGSGKKVQQSPDATKLVTPKRNRLGLTINVKEKNGVKKGEGRSEESPICLSSTPSTPTDEVGDEPLMSKRKGKGKEKEKEKDSSECIDLTGSPVSRGTKAAEAVGGKGSGKGKEKEKDVDKNKQRDKKEEEKRKKKEKEKKMMPVGTEDSDDAEVIPARAFKAPKAVAESTSDDESSSQQRNGKKVNGTTRVPVLNLNSIRDRQNKAMTKVKRKTRFGGADGSAPASTQKKVVDKDEEPPLKRARGRSDDRDTSNAASVASGSKGRALRKEPAGASTTRTKWPQKGRARSSDRNFVNCDICSMWYHYGCVGVSMGDERLKDDVNFICPPCSATGARSHNTGEGQRSKRSSASRKNSASEICARPDCSFKDSSDGREYWVRRIVGRKVKVKGGRGRVDVYLVEWEGYPLKEATWQEEDTMGNPAELIAEFVLAARKEGIDLDRGPDRTVLLKDARAVGWTADD